jgi:GNAT superfamily N-acetyltransferase
MVELLVNNATPKDKQKIAHLIAAVNSQPAHHCLHCDQKEAGILDEMAALEVPLEESFVVAKIGREIVGIFGADVTAEKDRAWLWGPFISGVDWQETAELLYDHFQKLFSPPLSQVTHFLNLANEQGQAFFRAKGFQEMKTTHVYQALPPTLPATDPFPEINPPEWRSFIALHEATFPGTYFSGRQIIERLGKKDKVFVCAEGDNVLGYVYANVEPTEGYIHFLGVEAESRGQGIGKGLLMTAVSWLFNKQKVPQVGLAVDDENNARRLYERCGFNLLYTGIGLRKEEAG